MDRPSNASFNAFNVIEHSILDAVKFEDLTLVFSGGKVNDYFAFPTQRNFCSQN